MSIARRSLSIVSSMLFAIALLLGSSQAFSAKAQGLTFFPVNPCRIVDTRNAGGVLQAGTPRSFFVNQGGSNFSYGNQGGSTSGCGIPTNAKSVFYNFVVVSPTSSGNLQAWPVGTAVPTASIANFASLSGLDLANGIAVPVCTSSCASGDLNVKINNANAQLVVDVVGYFADPTTPFPASQFVQGTYKVGTSTCSLTISAFGSQTQNVFACVNSSGGAAGTATWYTGPIAANPFAAELTTAGLNTIPGNEQLAWGKVGASFASGCFVTNNLFSASESSNTLTLTNYGNNNVSDCQIATPLSQP